MSELILVVNPGSASRKYALYDGKDKKAVVHFELEKQKVVYSINGGETIDSGISHLAFATSKLGDILISNGFITDVSEIHKIAVRVVAPSPFFQSHRILDEAAIANLKKLDSYAPLHISATLQEIQLIQKFLSPEELVGISDSAFHTTLPPKARSYGIPTKDAKDLGIERYGFHGLSVQSVVRKIKDYHSIPAKLVVCHLGSGSSVTALSHGKSVETTMGYSPLEGLVMATRSGSLDPTAAHALQVGLKLSPTKLQEYLNLQSGLLGISGKTSDIRELLSYEKQDDELSKLALEMYVYHAQLAIGQMAAALGGIDALLFTGTVGERSFIIRNRICHNLQFLGVEIDKEQNRQTVEPDRVTKISPHGCPVSTYVVPTDEMGEMAEQAQLLS